MSNLSRQLEEWGLSIAKVSLSRSISKRLGPLLPIAKESARLLDMYTFKYDTGGVDVAGFIVIPKGPYERDALPCIIFNRGGTRDFGLISQESLFTRVGAMARWGYVVIGSQYPGNALSGGKDERGGPSDIASILKLYELAQALSVIDERRIGMYGESRGGMMTYLCMKEVDWIKTALTVGGLANLERSIKLRPEMKKVFEASFGNTRQGILERSAVRWANELNKDTPLCLMHGTNDDRVSPYDALELAARLQHAHHPYSLHMFQGGDHGLRNLHAERQTAIRDWFDRYLQKGHKVDDM